MHSSRVNVTKITSRNYFIGNLLELENEIKLQEKLYLKLYPDF